MFVTAIIAAGGRGERLGASVPKQLIQIGGRSLLERSLDLFAGHPWIDEVIVALPADLCENPPSFLRAGSRPFRVVPGGPRRQDSVRNAFEAADPRSDIVVVHDAARPFASADLVSRTIAAAASAGAALAALSARDTIKRAAPAAGTGRDERFVEETLRRESIVFAQTPQAFRREILEKALALGVREGVDATDEATLAELAGQRVAVVEGEASNIKVTTPEDIRLAEAIARQEPRVPGGRAGIGYDLHRLVEGRRLILGGVDVPSPRGALGHSDADVVCHAVTDAVLGAASLGDIGRHFPDSDARWKDASSLDLLARSAAMVRDRGFSVANVDVTVILEAPKIAGHIDAMRGAVAGALGLDMSCVSIKGKTNEGVDAIGRGEAVAAHAIALVQPR